MKDIIQRELKKIEEQENVKIIMAIESGSRAWGFASPDSNYDVRFIYVRKEEDYLKLEKTRDVIEWQLDMFLISMVGTLRRHYSCYIIPIRQCSKYIGRQRNLHG